jgi:O-glycosyl hydrolase
MKTQQILWWGAVGLVLVVVASCRAQEAQLGSETFGSQTNWLRPCNADADCDGLSCLCGTCTLSCTGDEECAEFASGSCVRMSSLATAYAGTNTVCDQPRADVGLCLPPCDEATCPTDTGVTPMPTADPPPAACSGSGCGAPDESAIHVTIDASIRYQALIGFGASLAYDEDRIVRHPDKAALYDAMFLESGFDVIRMGNRFDGDNAEDLLIPKEIISEASARLGRSPTLLITSGSPPTALKSNRNRYCSNSDPACTLGRGMDGRFNYAAFAEHWRSSLDAYEDAGIHPDYVSIQNNADWVPPGTTAAEACRFLPVEGRTSVTTPDGASVDTEFPGYAEALEAVKTAVNTSGIEYKFSAPEVGSVPMVGAFSRPLPPTAFDAFAFHLYGTDPRAIDKDQLESVRVLGAGSGKPIIQSEMQANGIDTAILTHYALTMAGVSAYLQHQFVSIGFDAGSSGLIGVDDETFETLPAYHALAHFARATDPGWLRIQASTESSQLLTSAWLSPGEDALTVILINSGDSPTEAQMVFPRALTPLLERISVTRTIFDGAERSADLGALPADQVVSLPAHSIVTVAASSR